MRALVMVMVMVVALTSAAEASDHVVVPPAGWSVQPAELMAPQVDKLRAVKGTRSVDAQIYRSPDGAAQLTVVMWRTTLDTRVTKRNLTELDAGMVQGTANAAANHISDSRVVESDRIDAEAVDETADSRIHQRRLYVADRSDLVHVLMVACAGPKDRADWLAACQPSMASMHLGVANQVPFAESTGKATPYEMGYRVGQALGVILVIGAIIWWLRRRVSRPSAARA